MMHKIISNLQRGLNFGGCVLSAESCAAVLLEITTLRKVRDEATLFVEQYKQESDAANAEIARLKQDLDNKNADIALLKEWSDVRVSHFRGVNGLLREVDDDQA